MSRLMIDAFFPASVQQVEKFWLGRYLLTDVFFPPHVSETCPEVVIEIGDIYIRQPMLATSALLGLGIGTYCGLRLWTIASDEKTTGQPTSSASATEVTVPNQALILSKEFAGPPEDSCSLIRKVRTVEAVACDTALAAVPDLAYSGLTHGR